MLDKAGEPASVLDGAGTHRVLICQSGETSATVFQNLVIQNGYIGGDGGGMYNTRQQPDPDQLHVHEQLGRYGGGGMYNGDPAARP